MTCWVLHVAVAESCTRATRCPRGARRDGAPCGRPHPRRDLGCGTRGESEPLWPLVLASSRGNREGGRGGVARADPSESAVRGPDVDPGGCEAGLRECPGC